MDLETQAKAAIAGDRTALEALSRTLLDFVYRLALRSLADPREAEDATQEIVVTAITHLSQFEFRSSVKTWVTTQALHTLSRWSRRHAAVEPSSLEAIAERIDLGLSVTTAGQLPEGDVALLAREVQLGCTQGMLAALSETERLAYVVGAVLGADDVTGGALLDITPETFRQRLSRARSRMRPLLEQRCGRFDAKNPCRCERQAAAKQRAGPPKLRFVDAVALNEANDELSGLLNLGEVFREAPQLGAPRALWERMLSTFPRLTAGG